MSLVAVTKCGKRSLWCWRGPVNDLPALAAVPGERAFCPTTQRAYLNEFCGGVFNKTIDDETLDTKRRKAVLFHFLFVRVSFNYLCENDASLVERTLSQRALLHESEKELRFVFRRRIPARICNLSVKETLHGHYSPGRGRSSLQAVSREMTIF